MSAAGGGDMPEAVADGLNDALNLSYRPQATKICVWIGKFIFSTLNTPIIFSMVNMSTSVHDFIKIFGHLNRPFALTSQILKVSSRCSLTISVRVQQPHTAQELTILIQTYYKLLKNLLCLQKLYYA